MKMFILAALAAGGVTVGAYSLWADSSPFNTASIESNILKKDPATSNSTRTIISKSENGTAVISQSGPSNSATISQTGPSGTTVISQ